METTLPKLSGRSDLAAAMRYALAWRESLLRYLNDGCLAIDNNPAERALRSVTLGRKNYLFAGSDAGGERAAAIYSLIETTRVNGLDPQAYLADVIARIGPILHAISQTCCLTNWQPAPKPRLLPDTHSAPTPNCQRLTSHFRVVINRPMTTASLTAGMYYASLS